MLRPGAFEQIRQMLGFFVLKNGEFLIVLILPALRGLGTMCCVYSGVAFKRTSNPWVSTFLSTLLTGWFISTFFAQL
jgi:hypothetical protein